MFRPKTLESALSPLLFSHPTSDPLVNPVVYLQNIQSPATPYHLHYPSPAHSPLCPGPLQWPPWYCLPFCFLAPPFSLFSIQEPEEHQIMWFLCCQLSDDFPLPLVQNPRSLPQLQIWPASTRLSQSAPTLLAHSTPPHSTVCAAPYTTRHTPLPSQDLCTCSSFCLGCSSPRYSHDS